MIMLARSVPSKGFRALRFDLPTLRLDQVTSAGRGVRLHDHDHRTAVDRGAGAFAAGFNATTRGWITKESQLLDRVSPTDLGFAVEGAAMAATIVDLIDPARGGRRSRGPRLAMLAELFADKHPYTLHCGSGWGFAKLRRRPGRLTGFDPLLRWLVYDGFGFCQAFTAGPAKVVALSAPGTWRATERSHFDQGVGRALWFLTDPATLADLMERFEPVRRRDLWSGVGIAAVYAGGADPTVLRRLVGQAGLNAADLAVGAISGLQARECGDVASDHSRAAATILAGRDSGALLDLHDQALAECRPDADPFAYAGWQQRTRHVLSSAVAA